MTGFSARNVRAVMTSALCLFRGEIAERAVAELNEERLRRGASATNSVAVVKKELKGI